MFLALHRNIGKETTLRKAVVTGGGSANRVICQMIADIFGVPIYRSSTTDTATLGAAFRAMHGYNFHINGNTVDIPNPASLLELIAKPRLRNHEIYMKMLPKVQLLEEKLRIR